MKSRKEAAKRYYDTKVKPFRKSKPATGIPFMRCFMCGKLIDYKKYIEKTPTIRIDMKLYSFGGRANIKVVNFTRIDPEIREYVRKVLISKLKSMLQALNEPYRPLERVIEVQNIPNRKESFVIEPARAPKNALISRESFNISIPVDKIPIKETTEVKIW